MLDYRLQKSSKGNRDKYVDRGKAVFARCAIASDVVFRKGTEGAFAILSIAKVFVQWNRPRTDRECQASRL